MVTCCVKVNLKPRVHQLGTVELTLGSDDENDVYPIPSSIDTEEFILVNNSVDVIYLTLSSETAGVGS